MSLREITGIYQIINKQNLKCYVGSTRRNFHDRFKDHKRDLRNNKHHSKHLQAAWNKYSEECFEFEVLEIIDKSLDKLYFLQREQYWIDKFESHNKEFGYNVNPKTELTPTQANPEYYSEYFADLKCGEGYLVKAPYSDKWIKFTNISKYAKENNLTRKGISKALNNNTNATKGYIFKFLNVNKEANINRKIKFKGINKNKNYCRLTCGIEYYYILNISDNKQVLVSNLSKYCKDNDLSISNLKQTLTTARYHHKNFKLISLDKNKNNHKQAKWLVITPDNKELFITDLKRYCKQNNFNYSSFKQTSYNLKSIQYKGYRCYLLNNVLNNTQQYPKCDYTYKVIDPNNNTYLTKSLIELGNKLNVNGRYLSHTYRQVKNPLSNWKVIKL